MKHETQLYLGINLLGINKEKEDYVSLLLLLIYLDTYLFIEIIN